MFATRVWWVWPARREIKRSFLSYLPLKWALFGKVFSDQRIAAQEGWQMTRSTKCWLPQIGWENFAAVPLFPNWHMAWPNFLPRDKREEGTTCARERKWAKLWSSVLLTGQWHGQNTERRSPPPVAILLDVTLLLLQPANLHFTANCSRLLECHCALFAQFEKQAKRNRKVLTHIPGGGVYSFQGGGQVSLTVFFFL